MMFYFFTGFTGFTVGAQVVVREERGQSTAVVQAPERFSTLPLSSATKAVTSLIDRLSFRAGSDLLAYFPSTH